MWRTPRMAAVMLAGVLVSVGCGSPAEERSLNSLPVTTAPAVRTDAQPIATRFPALRDVTAVAWVGGTLGADERTDVPGPADVFLDAYVSLADREVHRLRSAYTWQVDAEFGPEPRAPLLRPTGAAGPWSRSAAFTTDLMAAGFVGEIWVDLDGGVVYLSVLST